MVIKTLLSQWNKDSYAQYPFTCLKYVHTYTVEEFKALVLTPKIYVKLHASGIIYFEFQNCDDWGLVDTGVPNNPVISVVFDNFGRLFFLLHEENKMPDSIYLQTARYKEIRKRQSSQNSYSLYSYESSSCYEDWTLDAFEGDESNYWNID